MKRASRDTIRQRCRALLRQHHGLEYVGRVIAGLEMESVVVKVGRSQQEIVEVPANVRDRLFAVKLLADCALGKDLAIQDDTAPRPTGEAVVAELVQLLPRILAILPVDNAELARLLSERRRVEVLMEGKTPEQLGHAMGNGDGTAEVA